MGQTMRLPRCYYTRIECEASREGAKESDRECPPNAVQTEERKNHEKEHDAEGKL